MPKRILWLMMGLAGALILGACTLDPPAPPTPAVPAALIGPPTPTPEADLAVASSFAEVNAAIRRIAARATADNSEQVARELEQYTSSLTGTIIRGWNGWVARTGPEDNTVWLYLDDPYARDASPTVAPDTAALGWNGSLAGLRNVSLEQVRRLVPGQPMHFSGKITEATADLLSGLSITLMPTDLTPTGTVIYNPGAAPALGPPATSLPGGPPPTVTPGPDSVPPFAEVAVIFADKPNLDQEQYLADLNGKQVDGWLGWVIQAADTEAVISPDDPFSTTPVLTPPPATFLDDYRTPLYVILNQAPGLRLGQRVQFSGTIRQPDQPPGARLRIAAAQVQVLEDRLAGITAPPDLDGVVISLARTLCLGTCPVYSVTAYGNGVVVWQGDLYVRVKGARITTIGPGALRQLVADFQQADYFGLKDEYSEETVSDNPYADTGFTWQGKQKQIAHYHGDHTTPAKLTILEDRIDWFLQTEQWIR